MIYGERSDRELKYAKAQAKATEFFVDSSAIPDFGMNSDELHYSSILTLSSYVDARLSGNNGKELLLDLKKTGAFYDAASNDGRNAQFSDGYWTLAMATYFLLGNYGSSKVAAGKVKNADYYGTRAGTLHGFVSYLLNPGNPIPEELRILGQYLEGGHVDEADVIEEAASLRTDANPEDLFFGGVLYVSILDSLSFSTRSLLPVYTKIGLEEWKPYLAQASFPKLLWQAQQQIGRAGVFSGGNAFVQLPTGTGKTKSIELLLRSSILAGRSTLSVVVAPLRALCSEISRDLSAALRGIADVRQTSDVMEVDSWLEQSSSGPKVLVFTPEKLGYAIHHSAPLLDDAGLFVFDEAHLLDSVSRGPSYELLLTEIFRAKPDAQKVLISAVVSNADKIANWAFGDSSLLAVSENIQVTDKSVGFIQQKGKKVSYVEADDISNEDFFVRVDLTSQPLKRLGRETRQRYFPEMGNKNADYARDLAIYYANRLLPNGACAIYVPKKISIQPLFKRLDDLLHREANLPNLKSSASEEELERLSNLVRLHYGNDNGLSSGISAGVLPHYGDLQGAIRQSVEFAVERGLAKCIACTSTLAEGVNLPIKYLIVTGARRGNEIPRTRDFQNLIGRTARSGKYSEGSILVAEDTGRTSSNRMYSELMKESNTERCESAILNLFTDVFDREKNPRRTLSGRSVLNTILEHIGDPQLEYELTNAFEINLGCDRARARALSAMKVRPLEAIESYISGIMSSDGSEDDVMNICVSTFAYVSSDDEMKERLLKLFQAIYESLDTVNADQASLCHLMQSGIRSAASLSGWIESKEGVEFLEGGCSDIDSVANAFLLPNPDAAHPLDSHMLAAATTLWIDGSDVSQITSYLNDTFRPSRKFRLTKVEGIVSGVIRFSLSHFISCLIDAIKQHPAFATEENLDNLCLLQRKVKYGVSSARAAMFCENVLDDRMVAKEVISILGESGSSDVDMLRFEAIAHKAVIAEYASCLPAYCAQRISKWVDPSAKG